jgi:hypothetical protein
MLSIICYLRLSTRLQFRVQHHVQTTATDLPQVFLDDRKENKNEDTF